MARRKRVAQLEEILEKIPQEKRYIGEKIATELIFMDGTLTELKRQIKENGTVEHFQQGKQEFLRESPALKSYNQTIQRFSQLYKQLADLLPKSAETAGSNVIYDFLKED